jgi:hypothetical protein
MNTASHEKKGVDLQDTFKQRLLEVGLLTEIKPPPRPEPIPAPRRVIRVEGNPVSELLMKERR